MAKATRPNIRGEAFCVGDKVAQYPDIAETVKDRGEILAIEVDGPFSVNVCWEGESADSAHIDRITLVEANPFS